MTVFLGKWRERILLASVVAIFVLLCFIFSASYATPATSADSDSSEKAIEVHVTDPEDAKLITHKTKFYEIRVIDADTGRGVPLVEFETPDRQYYLMTDSAGRIAISDPALLNKEVLFYTKSHGYYAPAAKDYEYAYPMWGEIKLRIVPGKGDVIRIKRINIAERLYRSTGSRIYEHTLRLGYKAPIRYPRENAQVMGQDGGLGIVYNNRIYWLWGDTTRTDDSSGKPRWGMFRASAATSQLPGKGGLDPSVGINYTYFTRSDGFVKDTHVGMTGGMVWPSFVGVVEGKLVTYYTGRAVADWSIMEHGIAVLNPATGEFKSIHKYDLKEKWRFPSTWGTFTYEDGGIKWLYLGDPTFVNKRVPATMAALKDPNAYEAWTCLADGSDTNPWEATILRDENGKPVYRWTKNAPPLSSKDELDLIIAGKITYDDAYFLPVDVENGGYVMMHAGTVYYNAWRDRWIFIGVQAGGSNSYLGEVWYSEAKAPTGPWKKAIKIVTHDSYSFYNPLHLPFFDQEGGKIIYFHGSYSYSFSGPKARDRYNDYNMVMYRLDLSDPRLQAVWD